MLIGQQKQTIDYQKASIETLQHQLHLFRTARFGRKSEKGVVAEQMTLIFDEAMLTPEVEQEGTTEEPQTITYTRTKKNTGRKALPQSLPYVEQVHDLTEEEKHCACGCELTHIRDEITEQLDVVPQMTFRVVHIRKQYACKGCEDTMKLAPKPKQPIPGSIATPGLIAAVINSKFRYHLEATLKKESASPADVFAARIQKAKPIVFELKAILDETCSRILPKSPLGKAVFYTLNHWEALKTYLYDGRLDIDNNLSERAIKPFVIGRKNWLFCGNEAGAHAGAALFSLIETCKHHQIDVFSWLKYTLTHVQQAHTLEQLDALLPYNIDTQLLDNMRSLPELIFPT